MIVGIRIPLNEHTAELGPPSSFARGAMTIAVWRDNPTLGGAAALGLCARFSEPAGELKIAPGYDMHAFGEAVLDELLERRRVPYGRVIAACAAAMLHLLEALPNEDEIDDLEDFSEAGGSAQVAKLASVSDSDSEAHRAAV